MVKTGRPHPPKKKKKRKSSYKRGRKERTAAIIRSSVAGFVVHCSRHTVLKRNVAGTNSKSRSAQNVEGKLIRETKGTSPSPAQGTQHSKKTKQSNTDGSQKRQMKTPRP